MPLGEEFQVDTYTTRNQYSVAVSSDPAGNFVVAWADSGQLGLFGQRYDASGNPRGGEFQINSTPGPGIFTGVDVALDPKGNFVAVWIGPGPDVLGQRFDASGAPLGAEFVVNTTLSAIVAKPVVDSAADGSFVVVFETSDGGYYGVRGIAGKRYDASGAALGEDFQVTIPTPPTVKRVPASPWTRMGTSSSCGTAGPPCPARKRSSRSATTAPATRWAITSE